MGCPRLSAGAVGGQGGRLFRLCVATSIFGRGGARRRAEEMGVPFLGEVPLNIHLRETGDEGKMSQALLPGSPERSYLLAIVEQLAAQISIQNIKNPKMPKLEILN